MDGCPAPGGPVQGTAPSSRGAGRTGSARARRPRDWAAGLTRAIEDADWRREQAAANREQVLARHLTEHTAELWATAWRTAREKRSRADRIGA